MNAVDARETDRFQLHSEVHTAAGGLNVNETSTAFQTELIDGALVITPITDLGEFDYQWFEDEATRLREVVDQAEVRSVVIDLHRTTSFGSSALGLFVAIWKKLNEKQGQFALCGISPSEEQILKAVKLDGQWNVCGTRDEALRAVLPQRQ
jgi:anti-anti-sigma factor